MLTQAQLGQYDENGYLVVQEAFSRDAVQTMIAIAEQLADKTKDIPITDPKNTFAKLDGSCPVLAKNSRGDRVIKRIAWAGGASEDLLISGRSQTILSPVSQLLAKADEVTAPSADHLINQLHYKQPGDEVTFPWHQDTQHRRSFDSNWTDVNGKGSFVQVILALDSCDSDNGPLYVLPGSHKKGYLNFGKTLQDKGLIEQLAAKAPELQGIEKVPLLLKPGDLAFMHPNLIHGSWPNTANRPRRVFINGFSYPGANHKAYPGEGSACTINLSTGEEVKRKPSVNPERVFGSRPASSVRSGEDHHHGHAAAP